MTNTTRKTLADISGHKNRPQPLVCLTAYTAPVAAILDPHCDVLLVGDSMGMVVYGMENTLGVTLDMMIAHTKAVMRGSKTAFVMADLPEGTYEEGPTQALESAKRLIGESGCGAIKIEGTGAISSTVELLVKNNIPVVGHIGLLPQQVVVEGGYKIKGRTPEQAEQLMRDAKIMETAGAFCVLIEGTMEPVSRAITQALKVPVIGIGASDACDGQILVTEDVMGLLDMKPPKFAKTYGDIKGQMSAIAASYAADVRARKFPAGENMYYPKTETGIPAKRAS